MSDIIDKKDDSVAITETSTKNLVTHTYGVAGTNPLVDFPKPVHILLRDAVASSWPLVTSDPPVTDIHFLNTWFTDSKDIEIIFLHSVEVRDVGRRSTDWRYMPMTTWVDIHIFVRWPGQDEEPYLLHKVRNALDLMVETNRATLIPNAVVTLESSDYIPEKDNLQNVWHWIYNTSVRYTKVLTI